MASEQFDRLISDLRKSTSGLEQLKILTRAWSTVRRMSRQQRVELATHVGLAESKALLERFGQPGGVSPARLAEAVLKAERANPGELNRLLGDLRDSSKRAEAVRKTVRLAEAAIEEMEAEPSSAAETEKPVPEAEARKIAPPALPPQPPPPRADVSPPIAPPPSQAAPDSVDREEPLPESSAPLALTAKQKALKKPPEETSTEIARGETPKTGATSTPSQPAAKPSPAPAPPLTTEKKLALGAESTLIGRFRLLHDAAAQGEMSEEDTEAALQAFPPGWPRRRALAALIRAGTVRDLDRIVAACSQLKNPRDEFWCVSALARSRELTAEELDKLMDGVAHDASRRLLKRIRKTVQG